MNTVYSYVRICTPTKGKHVEGFSGVETLETSQKRVLYRYQKTVERIVK